jgi:hypothetical protein
VVQARRHRLHGELTTPGAGVPAAVSGPATQRVYASSLEARTSSAPRRHHVDTRDKAHDGTEAPWDVLATFVGPDSYSSAVERARRYTNANRGANQRVRVRLEEVMDTFEC